MRTQLRFTVTFLYSFSTLRKPAETQAEHNLHEKGP